MQPYPIHYILLILFSYLCKSWTSGFCLPKHSPCCGGLERRQLKSAATHKDLSLVSPFQSSLCGHHNHNHNRHIYEEEGGNATKRIKRRTSTCSSPPLHQCKHQEKTFSRRRMIFNRTFILSSLISSTAAASILANPSSCQAKELEKGTLFEINDPNTYSSLVYLPFKTNISNNNQIKTKKKYPVIVFLHGAGKNELNIWSELTNLNGEYGGLLPSLIGGGGDAPNELLENFIVIAPYVGIGKRSFYDEPRSKLLEFVKWSCNFINSSGSGSSSSGSSTEEDDIIIDQDRIYLFGFR